MKRIVSEPEAIKKDYPMIYKYYESEPLRKIPLSVKLSLEKKRILEFLKSTRPSGKLLELGCGSGDFARSAAAIGYQAFGLDFNLNSAANSDDSFTFIHADIEETEFEKRTYDIICAFDVLEHCYDLKGLLTKIHNGLTADGLLAMTVPNAESLLHYLCLTANKMAFSSLGRFLDGIFVMSHPIYFGLSSLSYLLESRDFKIVHHDQSSTDLSKINVSPVVRAALQSLFMVSRLFSLQNRLVIFAKKK